MYTPREALFEPASKQSDAVVAAVELSRTRALGTSCPAGNPRVGSSFPEEASVQMFPESLLRASCLTCLFFDQVCFSTSDLKNICLMPDDKSPT